MSLKAFILNIQALIRELKRQNPNVITFFEKGIENGDEVMVAGSYIPPEALHLPAPFHVIGYGTTVTVTNVGAANGHPSIEVMVVYDGE